MNHFLSLPLSSRDGSGRDLCVCVQSMVRNSGAFQEISCVFCGQWPYFNTK